MKARILTIGIGALAFLLAVPALAAEPVLVSDGDRVTGALTAAEPEAGLAIDALEGTVVTLTMKTTGGDLGPEILLYDAEDVRVPLASRYRQKERKAKLRALTLVRTGRHTIVVRGRNGTGGAYLLKVRAEHPRKITRRGAVGAGRSGLAPFPAFAGTTVRTKVKGADGLVPRLATVLLPDTSEVALDGPERSGPVARHEGFAAAILGDHRLVVEGEDGSTGRYRARIKLDHPESADVTWIVDGSPEGTFTDGKTEPPGIPAPPPGPPPSPNPNPNPGPGVVTVSKETATFRMTIGTTVPLTDPWPHGTPLPVIATLENRTNAPVTVTFFDGGIADIAVKDAAGNVVDGIWAFPAVVTTKTFGPLEKWTITGSWMTQWVSKGTYWLEGRSSTSDARVPQGPRFQVRLQ